MSTSLSGGFSGDAGKSWSASLSIGRTTSYEGYRVSASLSGIGVKGTFESSSQTSKAVAFWTTQGRTHICGNKTSLDDSTRLFTNWK